LNLHLIDLVKTGNKKSELNEETYKGVFAIIQNNDIVPKDMPYSREIARVFILHGVSHHIGVNVHCCSKIKTKSVINDPNGDDCFVPGMLVSVEPGIYFNKEYLEIIKEKGDLQVINFTKSLQLADEVGGIRIEDDVLVTEDGNEVISKCPKTPDELEALFL